MLVCGIPERHVLRLPLHRLTLRQCSGRAGLPVAAGPLLTHSVRNQMPRLSAERRGSVMAGTKAQGRSVIGYPKLQLDLVLK